MSFESLGLAPELLQAVRDCGYTAPTPIQEQAIPQLLSGRDLMGCAQTGTGKTAAFALPILHQMRGTPPGHLRALVLVPTRELAIQVGRNIRDFGEPLGLRSTAVYGGVPIAPQEMMLRHGVDVLVATPGRLKDHIWRGLIDFKETRFLVLDEADRMLDMGFIDAVREIVALIPRERQTMLFSATLEPAIVRLARDILKNPVRVEVAPPATVADGIQHVMVPVSTGSRKGALLDLIRNHQMFRTLVFTRTRRGASRLAIDLKRDGRRVSSIHSDKSQSQRLAALEAFREGKIDFLVATDIAARGLDVQGISHVVNFDLPRNAEDYVHRIGRTARAGMSGVAISLVGPEDSGCVRSIEQLIGRSLSPDGSRSAARRELQPAGTGSSRPRAAVATATALASRSHGGSQVAARSEVQGRPTSMATAVRGQVPVRSRRPDHDPVGPRREHTRRDLDGRSGDRRRTPPPSRSDSGRGARGRSGPEPSLPPSRGYREKEGALRRVLSRLGFRQPN